MRYYLFSEPTFCHGEVFNVERNNKDISFSTNDEVFHTPLKISEYVNFELITESDNREILDRLVFSINALAVKNINSDSEHKSYNITFSCN